MERFADRLVAFTEAFLTWRRNRLEKKKAERRKKHPVVDWIEAFLWAAAVVLVVNQYVLQAYQIPSESMKNTLLINDRIFVDKFIFGPELLPGVFKLPGLFRPQRGEVVIFENPSYIGRGVAFDILQRVLYMLTLSLVDINRDEFGQPRAQFLIKRAVAMGGDRVRQRDGNLEIKPPGLGIWLPEAEFQRLSGITYEVQRLIEPGDYRSIRAAGTAAAYEDLRLPLVGSDSVRRAGDLSYQDGFTFDHWRSRSLYSVNPADRRYGARWRYHEDGSYVPAGRIFLLGDNRDNSRDGRFFGSVAMDRILGRAMLRYWPLNRLGGIH